MKQKKTFWFLFVAALVLLILPFQMAVAAERTVELRVPGCG